MAIIEVFTQSGCPFCQRAMRLFAEKGAAVSEINAPHGTQARLDAARRSGGRTSVPQIFIDGRHVGGCDDLLALDRSGELDGLLRAA